MTEDNYQNLLQTINDQKIKNDIQELKLFLSLIVKICNNHVRTPFLFDKVAKLLLFLEKDIKYNFSNFDIFNLFKSNKRILLSLIDLSILSLDQHISDLMMKKKYVKSKYPEYFCLQQKDDNTSISFEQKRLIGENDMLLCEIIRNDNIENFISYVTQNNLPLNSIIKTSIYETNQILLNKEPTLIEYSAFFGAIQIFRFLISNKVNTTPSLWIYAIHSNRQDLLLLLIESDIKPIYNSFDKCLEESIKCHHTDITH